MVRVRYTLLKKRNEGFECLATIGKLGLRPLVLRKKSQYLIEPTLLLKKDGELWQHKRVTLPQKTHAFRSVGSSRKVEGCKF